MNLFCCGAPATNTFQLRKLCTIINIFVQCKSLFPGTNSYEDIGTQVRATQNFVKVIFLQADGHKDKDNG